MNKEEMHAMVDIYNDLAIQGYTKEKIADKVHKDPSVVGKQITERHGNATLQIAYEYAELAGGRVVYVRDADWERWHTIDKVLADHEIQMQKLISEAAILNKQVSSLTETNESLTKQREYQQQIILRLEASVDKKEAKIDEKEQDIRRKDASIRQLLIDKGILRE